MASKQKPQSGGSGGFMGALVRHGDAIAVGGVFLAPLIAYIVVAQFAGVPVWSRSSRQLSHSENTTFMSGIWATALGLLAAAAQVVVVEVATAHVRAFGTLMSAPVSAVSDAVGVFHSLPSYVSAIVVLQCLSVPLLLSGWIGYATLRDPHGAAWGAVAFLAQMYLIASEMPVLRSLGAFAIASRRQSVRHDEPLSPNLKVDAELGHDEASFELVAAAATARRTGCCLGQSRRQRCRSCARYAFGWLAVLLVAVILIGWAVQAPLTSMESQMYAPPGVRHAVAAYTSIGARAPTYGYSDAQVRMHIHCTGPRISASTPAFIFEADTGASGAALQDLQEALVNLGWRACVYDRPGYGWSDPAPLGATSPVDTRRRLKDVLSAAGEPAPYILVGHGTGAEMAQVYASAYPKDVAGLAILDGYPFELRVLKYSKTASEAHKFATCAALQGARAIEAIGLMRLVADDPGNHFRKHNGGVLPAIVPPASGHYWQQRYADYCRGLGGPAATTDFLDAVTSQAQPANEPVSGVKWPPLPADVPVLVLPAGATVGEGIDASNAYWRVSRAYNATLSPTRTSSLIVCPGCSHAFPWERPGWVAATLHTYFTSQGLHP